MREQFSDALKTLSLKVTPKRLAILEILSQALVYLSPEEVWQEMKNSFKKIGLPTVYRNLEELSQGGVVIKIIHPNRKLYYYYCHNSGHHHHFVCITCRKVKDIAFCGVKEIEEEVKTMLKGHVLSHLLQVYGICQECSRASTIST